MVIKFWRQIRTRCVTRRKGERGGRHRGEWQGAGDEARAAGGAGKEEATSDALLVRTRCSSLL